MLQQDPGSPLWHFASKAAIAVSALVLFSWIQFSGLFLTGDDPFYHVGAASLYAKEGLVKSFPWTQCSIQKDGFADRHFLFHVGMIPFLWKDPIQGAKAYAVILATACVLVFALMLHSFRTPHVWFWVLLLFSSGSFFLYRFSVVRPQICAVVFALLSFWAVCREKTLWIFVVSVLSFLFYASAHLAIVFALIYAIAVYLNERRFVWKPLVASAAGFALGLLVHPHFPSIARMWFVQNFQVLYHSLAGTQGLNLGAELGAPQADDFLKACPVLLLACLGIILWAISKGKSLSKEATTAFLTMCAFVGLTFLSKRFMEYAAPFMCLFAALAFAHLWSKRNETPRKALVLFLVLLTFPAALSAAKAVSDTRKVIASVRAPELKPAALWLLSNAKKGDIVFTCDWDDFPQLFFFNRQNYYLVNGDPTFFLAYDRNLFDLWNQIRFGARRDVALEISKNFSAKYFLATNDFEGAIKNAQGDKKLKEVFADGACRIFQVLPIP